MPDESRLCEREIVLLLTQTLCVENSRYAASRMKEQHYDHPRYHAPDSQ